MVPLLVVGAGRGLRLTGFTMGSAARLFFITRGAVPWGVLPGVWSAGEALILRGRQSSSLRVTVFEGGLTIDPFELFQYEAWQRRHEESVQEHVWKNSGRVDSHSLNEYNN